MGVENSYNRYFPRGNERIDSTVLFEIIDVTGMPVGDPLASGTSRTGWEVSGILIS